MDTATRGFHVHIEFFGRGNDIAHFEIRAAVVGEVPSISVFRADSHGVALLTEGHLICLQNLALLLFIALTYAPRIVIFRRTSTLTWPAGAVLSSIEPTLTSTRSLPPGD